MKANRSVTLVLVAMTILLAACSSAPPAPEGIQDRKNRAADYLKFGRQAFQEAKYDQALSFYLFAVDLDTAVDDEAGMAASWNSVATAQTALGKGDEARDSLAQAETLAALSGDKSLVLQVADCETFRAFGRMPTSDESKKVLAYVGEQADAKMAWEDVVWAMLNSKEFLFNH